VVEMNRKLLRFGYMLSLLLGIIEVIVILIFSVLTLGLGLILGIIPIIGFIMFRKFYKEGEKLVEENPEEAKTKFLISSVISLVLVSRIGGLLMLIGTLTGNNE